MDYMSGLTSTKKGNDCVFMIVDRFSKMVILVACKKSILEEEHHSRGHCQALIQKILGTFLDTTNHHLILGQPVPQHILVKPLVTDRNQYH
jgi:hypothetical protein